jgi:hypothetical protein
MRNVEDKRPEKLSIQQECVHEFAEEGLLYKGHENEFHRIYRCKKCEKVSVEWTKIIIWPLAQ